MLNDVDERTLFLKVLYNILYLAGVHLLNSGLLLDGLYKVLAFHGSEILEVAACAIHTVFGHLVGDFELVDLCFHINDDGVFLLFRNVATHVLAAVPSENIVFRQKDVLLTCAHLHLIFKALAHENIVKSIELIEEILCVLLLFADNELELLLALDIVAELLHSGSVLVTLTVESGAEAMRGCSNVMDDGSNIPRCGKLDNATQGQNLLELEDTGLELTSVLRPRHGGGGVESSETGEFLAERGHWVRSGRRSGEGTTWDALSALGKAERVEGLMVVCRTGRDSNNDGSACGAAKGVGEEPCECRVTVAHEVAPAAQLSYHQI